MRKQRQETRAQKPEHRNGKKNVGVIFVFSGPSGSGKTTIAKSLLRQPQLRDKLVKPVSFTTRPKRAGEREGRDYFFVSRERFRRLLAAKKILEYTHYLGYDYGTSRDYIDRAIEKGLCVILVLDIQGARFIKNKYADRAATIFVKPPSLTTTRQRIVARARETEAAEINQRLQVAVEELKHAEDYDHCLINASLNKAVKEASLIIKGEINRWRIFP